MRAQVMRAVLSIATNIAEGAGRATRPDLARFIEMATASANEVEHHLTVANDFGMLDDPTLSQLVDDTAEVRRMLFGFRRTLLRRDAEERDRTRRRPRGGTGGD